jgi:succinate dehydrogenase/fumarate reductase flavoprotein subunit
MGSLWEAVVTKEMVGLAVAAIALMYFVGGIAIKGKRISETKVWKNFGSFILAITCAAGSFAPGVNDIPVKSWGSILVFGFVAAFVAHLGRAAFKPWLAERLKGKQ